MSFIRYIDYARSRNYELRDLLQLELTSTSFFLTKDGYLRKSVKTDLASELKKMFKEKMAEKLPDAVEKRMAILDFMGFARQVPVKKAKLKTFSDLRNHLWTSFHQLPQDCERIDIVFDLYHQKSIKGNERNRRGKQAGILTDVSHNDQALGDG